MSQHRKKKMPFVMVVSWLLDKDVSAADLMAIPAATYFVLNVMMAKTPLIQILWRICPRPRTLQGADRASVFFDALANFEQMVYFSVVPIGLFFLSDIEMFRRSSVLLLLPLLIVRTIAEIVLMLSCGCMVISGIGSVRRAGQVFRDPRPFIPIVAEGNASVAVAAAERLLPTRAPYHRVIAGDNTVYMVRNSYCKYDVISFTDLALDVLGQVANPQAPPSNGPRVIARMRGVGRTHIGTATPLARLLTATGVDGALEMEKRGHLAVLLADGRGNSMAIPLDLTRVFLQELGGVSRRRERALGLMISRALTLKALEANMVDTENERCSAAETTGDDPCCVCAARVACVTVGCACRANMCPGCTAVVLSGGKTGRCPTCRHEFAIEDVAFGRPAPIGDFDLPDDRFVRVDIDEWEGSVSDDDDYESTDTE